MPGKARSTAAASRQPVTRRLQRTSVDRLVPQQSSDVKLNHLSDEPVQNSGDSSPAEPMIRRTRRLPATNRGPEKDGINKNPQITSAMVGLAADTRSRRVTTREKNSCCSDQSGRESMALPAQGMDSEGTTAVPNGRAMQPLPWPQQGLPPRGAGAELPTTFAATWQRLLGSQQLCQAVMRRSFGLTFATAKKERMALEAPVVSQLDKYEMHNAATPFSRRITAMTWHPTKTNLLAAGSKGGELALWSVDKEQQPRIAHPGIGPGGVIQALKFWPTNQDSLLSATMDSGIVLRDLTRGTHSILYDVDVPCQIWLCSVDANSDIIAGGDSHGTLVLLSGEGKKIFSSRVHKSKITHVEFCPVGDYLLCTASVDRTVKLWDFRNMKGKSGALCELQHDRGINSACFSRTNGCRLLTTDQHDQIRIYTSPTWSLEEKILHPHRFFQHLTPIKASWHPLVDVAIIGRYPEQNDGPDKRRLDAFRADTGQLAGYIYDPVVRGISSLNYFDATADYVSSGMGSSIIIWKKQLMCEPDPDDDSPTTSKAGQEQDGLPRGPRKPKRPSTSKQDAAAVKAKLARK